MQNIIQEDILESSENDFRFFRIKSVLMILFIALTAIVLFSKEGYALQGNFGSHDPSTLVKDGNKYWQFTTGGGVYRAYSTDLINWTSADKPVFPLGTWPAWIDSIVPGFKGEFWAPDCLFMNGRYYLYYSCSTFGSAKSAIGVATNTTLDQDSPNYKWTDLGMVVSSSVREDFNAIDPAIFKDSNGKVYMSYGSFHAGIGIVEIDSVTGKRKNDALATKIAGVKDNDWEAPYLIKEGSYYYLFVNRGFCCKGAKSTYYIVMGRSTSAAGPYLDKDGKDLNEGGGTTVLGSSGKYIGPGHVGLLRENGINIVSIHYYDANENGAPRLDILNMGFSNGWPFLTRDWIANGEYKITNKNSGLVWNVKDCAGSVTQATWSNHQCQKWNLTSVGDGNYKITNVKGERIVNLINCNTDKQARLQLTDSAGISCQKFKIERAADGTNVFTPLTTGSKLIEISHASTSEGAQLSLRGYTGNTCQRWTISPPTGAAVVKKKKQKS